MGRLDSANNELDAGSLRLRIRVFCVLFLLGLTLSGATAIPLVREIDWIAQSTGTVKQLNSDNSAPQPAWKEWLMRVQSALHRTQDVNPFLFYGTDWLAFGHFVIALAFVGALRDPVRNRWLFDFGILACAALIPYALIFGSLRGIPAWWRLIDCSFGVIGFIPLWLCKRWATELEALSAQRV